MKYVYYFEKKTITKNEQIEETKLYENVLNYGALKLILVNGKPIGNPMNNAKLIKKAKEK